ncbi:hypothetical protein NXX09_13775 [Bacteroides uniformis]|nr:hypothetical protein [Bacteroides uniformis]
MVIVSKPNNDRHFLSFSRKLFLSVISLFLVFAACFIAYQVSAGKGIQSGAAGHAAARL